MGVTIEIQESQGSKFTVKLTVAGRSNAGNGNKPALPQQAQQQPLAGENNNNNIHAEAAEQFQTPDAEEFRISGKLPQLGWFQELFGAETPAFGANQKVQEQAPPADEDEQGITVLDSLVDSSSGVSATAWRRIKLGCWLV